MARSVITISVENELVPGWSREGKAQFRLAALSHVEPVA